MYELISERVPSRPAELSFYHHKGNFHQNARIWALNREAVCTAAM